MYGFGDGTMASVVMAIKAVASGVMAEIDSFIFTTCFVVHAIASGLIGTIGALWAEEFSMTGMPETIIIPEPTPADPPRPKPRKVSALPPVRLFKLMLTGPTP